MKREREVWNTFQEKGNRIISRGKETKERMETKTKKERERERERM